MTRVWNGPLRLTGNSSVPPSVTDPASAIETSGVPSSSRTVTVASDGVPGRQVVPSPSASVTVASDPSTSSSTVPRRSVAVASPTPKVTFDGAAAASTPPGSVTVTVTSSASDTTPARVRVNAASPPSATAGASAATVTTEGSSSRIRPVASMLPGLTNSKEPVLATLTTRTRTVSSGSSTSSLSVTTRIVPSVTPGAKVRMPETSSV